jgi:hypothetical protein
MGGPATRGPWRAAGSMAAKLLLLSVGVLLVATVIAQTDDGEG